MSTRSTLHDDLALKLLQRAVQRGINADRSQSQGQKAVEDAAPKVEPVVDESVAVHEPIDVESSVVQPADDVGTVAPTDDVPAVVEPMTAAANSTVLHSITIDQLRSILKEELELHYSENMHP